MSWFMERVVVPYMPIVKDLPGNIRLIIGCDGRWIYTSLNSEWSEFYIYQKHNFSGKERDEYEESKPKQNRIFKIKSSKGDKDYTIKVIGEFISCNCTGFAFRKKCRHVEDVKELLSREDI